MLSRNLASWNGKIFVPSVCKQATIASSLLHHIMSLPESEMDQYLLDVQVYFTATEWAQFSSYERICIKNVKENYEMMNKVGLQVNPPMFMQRQLEIKIEIKEENDSEDEEMMLEPFQVPVEYEKPDHINENKLHEDSPNHVTIKVEIEYDDDGNLLNAHEIKGEGIIALLAIEDYDEAIQTQINLTSSGDQRSGDLNTQSGYLKAEQTLTKVASGGDQTPKQLGDLNTQSGDLKTKSCDLETEQTLTEVASAGNQTPKQSQPSCSKVEEGDDWQERKGSDSGIYRCEYCGSFYAIPLILARHLKYKHGIRGIYMRSQEGILQFVDGEIQRPPCKSNDFELGEMGILKEGNMILE
ncbi:uncharacterized protein LOC129263773 isoform X2 [Lytechinus pictus]